MTWAELTTVEQAFGSKDKPYRYGDRVPRELWNSIIDPREQEDLNLLLQIIISNATVVDSSLHVMSVGSVLQGDHFDIDLVCCTEPANMRNLVVERVIKELPKFPFKIDTQDTIGSTLSFRQHLFTSKKVHAMSYEHWNIFDLNFIGASAGSWQDVIDFHERTGLIHCILG